MDRATARIVLRTCFFLKMAEYGVLLNEDNNLDKLGIRTIAKEYFGNPIMTKIKVTDTGDSMYAARVQATLNKPRYLLCLVENGYMPIGSKLKLESIIWYSLQTREIDDDLPCDTFTYTPKNTSPFNAPVVLVERQKEMTIYENKRWAFRVALLHVDKRLEFEYPDAGTFATALETYQALILI